MVFCPSFRSPQDRLELRQVERELRRPDALAIGRLSPFEATLGRWGVGTNGGRAVTVLGLFRSWHHALSRERKDERGTGRSGVVRALPLFRTAPCWFGDLQELWRLGRRARIGLKGASSPYARQVVVVVSKPPRGYPSPRSLDPRSTIYIGGAPCACAAAIAASFISSEALREFEISE